MKDYTDITVDSVSIVGHKDVLKKIINKLLIQLDYHVSDDGNMVEASNRIEALHGVYALLAVLEQKGEY